MSALVLIIFSGLNSGMVGTFKPRAHLSVSNVYRRAAICRVVAFSLSTNAILSNLGMFINVQTANGAQ